MRRVFTVTAAVLIVAVVVQFFLAGIGAIQTGPRDTAFAPHETVGWIVLLLSIAVTILAAVARLGKRLIGMAGLTIGLVVLQALIALVADALGDAGSTAKTIGQVIFGLHAVNGLVIMMLAVNLLRGGRNPATPAETELASQQHA